MTTTISNRTLGRASAPARKRDGLVPPTKRSSISALRTASMAPTAPTAPKLQPHDKVDPFERGEWITQAACRQGDPDALFVRGAEQRKAAAICRRCPVLMECRADALDNKVEFGVWGGLTERQRRAVLRKNPEVTNWAEHLKAGREIIGL